MENGSKKFGMLAPRLKPDESQHPYALVGCVAEIQNQPFMLEDGRAFVETRGGRRFKVLSTQDKDGYLVGNVEYFDDDDENLQASNNNNNSSPENETRKKEGSEKNEKFIQMRDRCIQTLNLAPDVLPRDPTLFSFFFAQVVAQNSPSFGYHFLTSKSTKDRLDLLLSLLKLE